MDYSNKVDSSRIKGNRIKRSWMTIVCIIVFLISLAGAMAATPVMNTSTILPAVVYYNGTMLGYCNATDADDDYLNYDWKLFVDGAVNESGTNFGDFYCYQESANESTSCGGVDTGNWSSTSTNWHEGCSASDLFDGDWTTSCGADLGTGYSYAYIDYTKPAGATNASLWQISGDSEDPTPIINKTIPQDCWVAYVDKLKFKLSSGFANPYIRGGNYSCYNGTSWKFVNANNVGSRNIAEEAMWWHINKNPQAVEQNVENFTDFESNQVVQLECTAYDGNYSSPFNSSTLTIQNYVPTISNIGITPTTSYIEDDLVCKATPSDAEGVYTWCYQETANADTACGGLNTGSYDNNGFVSDRGWDGVWTTSQESSSGLQYVVINYDKPTGVNSNSLWQGKDLGSGTFNLSIPTDCWDYSADNLTFRINGVDLAPGEYTEWTCYNGTDFKVLRNNTYLNYSVFYEEAMWWRSRSDTLTVEYFWYNGTTLMVSGNTTSLLNRVTSTISTLDAANTTNGDTWNCTTRTWDGYNYSSFVSTTLSITNRLPVIENVSVVPAPNNATNDLNCSHDFRDADGDSAVTTWFRWFKSGINQNVSAQVLGADNTSDYEEWYCGVMVYDGFDNATSWINSSTVVVLDHLPPVLSNLSLSSTAGYSDDVLTITAYCEDAMSLIYPAYPYVEILDPNLALYNYTMTNTNGTAYIKTYTPGTVGVYEFSFYCKDQSGNMGSNLSTGLIFTSSTRPVSPGGSPGGGLVESPLSTGTNASFTTTPRDLADILTTRGDEISFNVDVISTSTRKASVRVIVKDECGILDNFEGDRIPIRHYYTVDPFDRMTFTFNFKIPAKFETEQCNVFLTFEGIDGSVQTLQLRVWNNIFSGVVRGIVRTITYPIVFEKEGTKVEMLTTNAFLVFPGVIDFKIPFFGLMFLAGVFVIVRFLLYKNVVDLRGKASRLKLFLVSFGITALVWILLAIPLGIEVAANSVIFGVMFILALGGAIFGLFKLPKSNK